MRGDRTDMPGKHSECPIALADWLLCQTTHQHIDDEWPTQEELDDRKANQIPDKRQHFSQGDRTPDSTVDCKGFTMEEILAESDKLVAELRKRYPVVIPEPRLDYAAIQEKK